MDLDLNFDSTLPVFHGWTLKLHGKSTNADVLNRGPFQGGKFGGHSFRWLGGSKILFWWDFIGSPYTVDGFVVWEWDFWSINSMNPWHFQENMDTTCSVSDRSFEARVPVERINGPRDMWSLDTSTWKNLGTLIQQTGEGEPVLFFFCLKWMVRQKQKPIVPSKDKINVGKCPLWHLENPPQ